MNIFSDFVYTSGLLLKQLKFFVIIFSIAYMIGCSVHDKKPEQKQDNAYINSIKQFRAKAFAEFSDPKTTPLDSSYFAKNFSPQKYYPVNKKYLIKARFSIDTSGNVFEMPTTTKRKPHYRIYGYADFILNDTSQRLTVYQNMDFIHHHEYGKYLFIPFRDKTNNKTTYGAGRYLEILIPKTDSVFIDFNRAYNPYCAYSHRWSCPLVPFENWLDVAIMAGEKRYFDEPE